MCRGRHAVIGDLLAQVEEGLANGRSLEEIAASFEEGAGGNPEWPPGGCSGAASFGAIPAVWSS